MIFYEHIGRGLGAYKCLDIAKDEDALKSVDDFVRSIRGWRNSVRLSVKEDPYMPEPSFVALYEKSETSGKGVSNNARLEVSLHVRDDKKTAVSREAFCSFTDTLKNNSKHGREVLKQAAKSPEVNDFEVEFLMEFLFKNVRTHKNRLAQ